MHQARLALLFAPLAWAFVGCADTPSDVREADAQIPVELDGGRDASVAPRPTVGADYLAFEPLLVPPAGVLELHFDLPAEARSFVLTANASQRGRVLLLRLTHPDGHVLFDREAPESPFVPALVENLELGVPLSVAYPSAAADLPLSGGTYRVQLGFIAEGTTMTDAQLAQLTVDVLWQTRAEPTALPVNVWVARGASETAASLIADSVYLEGFTKLKEIFAPAGFSLEPLRAFDLGPEGAEFAKIEYDDDLDVLLRALEESPVEAGGSAREQNTAGLDIILVERFVTAGKTVRGKSTGIPGPPAHPKLTRRGAVVLALASLPRDPLRIAEAFAHEATHYLGLRHTTELDGTEHDPLADTPECPIALASYQTTAGELLLSSADCADYDGSNLLFPMPPFDDAPQHALSPEQIAVLRTSPLLR